MLNRLRALALAVPALAGLVAAAAVHGNRPGAAQPPLSVGAAAKPYIKHVVVIVQENRTFDNIFGGIPSHALQAPVPFPGANAVFPLGVRAYMTSLRFDDPGAFGSHDAWQCVNQTAYGPRFSTQAWYSVWKHDPKHLLPAVCSADHDYDFFRYVPQIQRSIYWEIAKKYALGDHFFAATSTASYPGHQYIVAGAASFPYAGKAQTVADQPAPGNGCFDTAVGNGLYSTPVLGKGGFSTTFPMKTNAGECYGRPTYADQFDAAHVTWRHYTTTLATDGHPFNGFMNIVAWYRATATPPPSPPPAAAYFPTTTQILTDVGHGLPQFTWVKPPCIRQSDHPGAHGHNGPNWVGTVINAIGRSQDWKNTVIFVIWDDWGGFYDHVVPPTPAPNDPMGRGVRIPFLVISPYLAKRGEVVHTTGDPGSIMKFANELFGVDPLTDYDRNANDLTGYFDFSRNAITHPFVPIVGADRLPYTDSMCAGSMRTIAD
jgi:phospholipase C